MSRVYRLRINEPLNTETNYQGVTFVVILEMQEDQQPEAIPHEVSCDASNNVRE